MGTVGNPSTGKNVSIGYNANKNDNLVARIQSTAVGSHTQAADDALALGYNAKAAGNGSVAAGFNAKAEDAASMALGQGAMASGGNIAIGNGSQASAAMLSGTGYLTGTAAPSTGVSVGTAAALRRITNVADGAQDQDAVTVAQLKKSIDETVRQINANITPGTGSTGVFYDTVTGGQESITLKNTDQKGTLIHNVAAGENDTDAVNVKQMKETMDQAKTHYYSVKSTSGNNYNNDMAAGEDSMAAGVSAKALEKRSVAIGNNVQAQGEGSIALGTGYEETNGGTSSLTQTLAVTGYKYNMAIGAGAESYGNHSIAMGTRAVTSIKNGGSSVDKAVAIGYTAGASDDKAIAIGSEAKSNSKSATAVGDQSQALANNALAIGTTARATKESSGAIGTANTVSGVGTYVIGAQNSAPAAGVISNGSDIKAANSGVFGNENTLDGENNRVVGNSNIVKKETAKGLSDIMLTGNNNTVSGDPDTSTQDDAGKVSGITITGSKNTVKAVNNTKPLTDVQIVGNNNTIDTSNKTLDLSNTQVLGSNVTATMGNSVYLGSGSAYVAAGASTKGMAAYSGDGTYAYAGGTPAGVVTVGAKGKERRIQNVAAGLVAPQSTDAVNGSQLYTMTRPLRFGGDNSTIGATSAADVNVVKRGSDQAMSILGGADGSKLSDNNIGVVADAANNKFNIKLAKELKGLTSVTTGDTVMNNNGVTINNGAAGNTVSLTKDGLDNGGNKITNVASGGTTDSNAANIGDVKAAVTNVTNALTVKGLDFEGNDGAANKVHRDLGTKLTIKGGLTDVTTGVSGKNLGVKKNAAGDGLDLVMSEKPEFTEVTAGTGTNKVVINDNGVHVGGKTYINNTGLNANNQKITNVAAGTDNSDAVNFGQLKDVVAAGKTILKDGKNTTVEGDGTANNPYKVNVNDDLVLGKAGADGKDGSIGVNGKDGSAVVINGKDGSIGLNGTNGANGLTIKGANGANGVDGTDGNNGTNGMTRIVYEDKNGVTHEVATMGDGMKYGGDTGAVIKKKLNEQVNVVGGITDESKLTTEDNLGVVSDGSNNLKVRMAKELKGLTSVTTKDAAGNTTVTNGAGTTMTDGAGNKTEVTAGGIAINKHDNLNPDGTVKDPQKTVSLTADGLNNGGNQIHNVAKGTAGTDAVNVDQLKDEIAANATKLVDGKNTTVEGDGTAANPYKVNVKDNINLGEKGANGKDGSIGVNGKDGSAVVINGKDGSIGLNGKDGKDGLTMKSAAGANGVDGTDGNNGTNGMTRIVYEDKNHVTHEVATMDDGLKFAGNTGTVAKKLNETMTIKGTGRKLDTEYDSSNIKTMVNGNGEMIVGLDKNLKADSLAINGKDGKDGATIKGGDGKPGVDGTNITRLVIEEKDGKQHDIATLDDGMKYGGDTGAVIKKKLNEQVNVVGGITNEDKLTTEDNLGVVSDGSNNLKVKMAKDLKGLETVTTKTVTADTGNITTVNSDTVNAKTVKTGDTTINDNGLTINNGPSITKNGVDAGDKKITNVAPGDISPTSKDAVNGSQLFQTNQSISRLGDRVNKVGAGAAALAALHPLDFDPDDKWDVAAGYGNYKDAHAVAVGAFYRPNEDTMFSVGGSFGGGENMVNAGVSLKLGQGNHVSTSKVAMAKEIKDLRNEVEQLRSALGQVVQGQALDPMKIKLFPDIPENHWAYEYIATLAGNDIIEGYPDGTFAGDRMMTRYEFGAIVYRAMQRGFEVPARMLKEFEPELERFRVDTIAQNKAGQPTIERVRVIHNR
ncbi:S-layer homology domain-containing protein [Dialister invisus]|uniref:S-layer homology domain-containing protein n=1 Tax=Dialister invisus TaxID=218538 RepID=UPI003AB69B06